MSGPLPRPWAGPSGLYRPGSTLLHRSPAGAKLVGLAVLGLAVVLVPGPGPAVVGAAVAGALAGLVRVPWRAWRGGLVLALVVGAGRSWTGTAGAGVAAGLHVLALVLAAAALTASTTADDTLSALAAAARPARRLGVRPDRAALAAVLMVRSVPTLVGAFAAAREAARARGCERDPRTWLTPAATRSVAHAHAVGEALAARGLGDA